MNQNAPALRRNPGNNGEPEETPGPSGDGSFEQPG